MQKINYKSDFDFTLALFVKQDNGVCVEQGAPKHSIYIRLSNDPNTFSKSFDASFDPIVQMTPQPLTALPIEPGNSSTSIGSLQPIISGRFDNCTLEGERIKIIVDGHEFNKGPLYIEIKVDFLDDKYPDGIKTVVFVQRTSIELVGVGSEDPATFTEKIYLPSAFTGLSATTLSTENGANEEENSDATIMALTNAYNAGLDAIRAALTDKGVETSSTDSFITLAEKIKNL